MSTALLISAAALSDCGKQRQVNEDSWISDTNNGLFAVADGMGGHGSGDVASKLTIEAFSTCLISGEQSVYGAAQQIRSAIEHANNSVFSKNNENNKAPGSGMGTTFVGVYLPEPDAATAHVFNIGDSRLYRFRAGALTQLTEDHTLLREWQLNKQRGPAPPGNIIMRAIGLFEDVDCDITTTDIQTGDRLLLCSDGLSDMLSDAELSSILESRQNASPSDICDELVRTANRNGGIDNITTIVIALD